VKLPFDVQQAEDVVWVSVGVDRRDHTGYRMTDDVHWFVAYKRAQVLQPDRR